MFWLLWHKDQTSKGQEIKVVFLVVTVLQHIQGETRAHIRKTDVCCGMVECMLISVNLHICTVQYQTVTLPHILSTVYSHQILCSVALTLSEILKCYCLCLFNPDPMTSSPDPCTLFSLSIAFSCRSVSLPQPIASLQKVFVKTFQVRELD